MQIHRCVNMANGHIIFNGFVLVTKQLHATHTHTHTHTHSRLNIMRLFHVQEHSLTQEVLRKVSPTEAELLKDPTIKAKVKFR